LPEKEELKSVPLDVGKNKLVKASVGEGLETTRLMKFGITLGLKKELQIKTSHRMCELFQVF
jgi:hypothetical protein